MRMMLKVRIPVEAGNAAIQSGELPKALEAIMDQLKPEAAYFVADTTASAPRSSSSTWPTRPTSFLSPSPSSRA